MTTNFYQGIFLAHDALHNPISLDWEEIGGQTERLSEKIRSLTEIFVSAYAKTEVEFAHKKPNDVANDFMLKSLAPLLAQGVNSVDWQIFEDKTIMVLEQFFATTDWAKYSGAQDIHIFVVAKDKKTGKRVGAIQFFTTPEFAPDNIKAALFGVIPSEQGRGLEQLLMSSIFKLRPDVKRIFLDTRATNQSVVALYESWGFVQFAGKLPNWVDLEYLTNKSDVLQKISEKLF